MMERFLVQRVYLSVGLGWEYGTRVEDSERFKTRWGVDAFIKLRRAEEPMALFLVTEYEEVWGGGSWQGVE